MRGLHDMHASSSTVVGGHSGTCRGVVLGRGEVVVEVARGVGGSTCRTTNSMYSPVGVAHSGHGDSHGHRSCASSVVSMTLEPPDALGKSRNRSPESTALQ